MTFSNFELAQPAWLWALWMPLLNVWLAPRYKPTYSRLQDFADAHLLPHLLLNADRSLTKTNRRGEIWWLFVWVLGVLALAGPRWDYDEQEVVRPRMNLMILLDLSESMRVNDLPHSRLEQAKQEIEELLEQAQEIDIGLMVFAGLPHLVTPLSDDYKNLTTFLNELFIDDLKEYSIPGTRLELALAEASRWLNRRGTSRETAQVLLISDGDFAEAEVNQSLAFLKTGEFQLQVLGVGTATGNFIPLDDSETAWLKDANGNTVISRLNESYLTQLATAGGGIYRYATYRNDDTQAVLAAVKQHLGGVDKAEKTKQKLWHERFYLLVALMMVFILPSFRREIVNH